AGASSSWAMVLPAVATAMPTHKKGTVLSTRRAMPSMKPTFCRVLYLGFSFMNFTSCLYPTTKKVPGHIPGTNCRFGGTNRSQLGDQDLGGEGAVLTVAAEIPVQLFDDVVDAHQPEAVPRPLGGGEPAADLFLFAGGRKVGKADVQL